MVFVSDGSGRFATSYIPQCLLNEKIKQKAGIKDNYNYKLFLQRNAEKLMEEDRKSTVTITTKCCDCDKCLLISRKDFFK